MSINQSELIKQLRNMTGVGISACKKALEEAEWVVEKAIEGLRKLGLAAASKKSSRTAAAGLACIKGSTIVEVNCETDFVQKNNRFQTLVRTIAITADKHSDISELDELLKIKLEGGDGDITVGDAIASAIAAIGENIKLRRITHFKVGKGVVAYYVHNKVEDAESGIVANDMGGIGVLVALESEADKEKLFDLGKSIAMHIAASAPKFLKKEEVPLEVIEKEREIFTEKFAESGKPKDVIAKMVEGALNKFYQENVLLEQQFALDPKLSISQLINEAQKEYGNPITLTSYARFMVGEGIQKDSADFAAEVAAMTKGS